MPVEAACEGRARQRLRHALSRGKPLQLLRISRPTIDSMMRKSLLLLLVVSGVVSSAPAREYQVPGDLPAIQAAIAAAADGDQIVVAPGVYEESLDTLG